MATRSGSTYLECFVCGTNTPCRLQIFGGVDVAVVKLCPLDYGGDVPVWKVVERGPALMKVFEELVTELEKGGP